jgi:hypothetical protein
MPISIISVRKFDKIVGRTAAEREYAELVDEVVGAEWYEADASGAVGEVSCEPGGSAVTYGWAAFYGTTCIGRGTGLVEKDEAFLRCVKRMLGYG